MSRYRLKIILSRLSLPTVISCPQLSEAKSLILLHHILNIFSCWEANIFLLHKCSDLRVVMSFDHCLEKSVPYKYFQIGHQFEFWVWIWCWICTFLKDGSPRNWGRYGLLFNIQAEHQRTVKIHFSCMFYGI